VPRIPTAAILVLAGIAAGCGAEPEDPIYADTHPLSVPVTITPSIQIASGQVILYKASNVGMGPAALRLQVYTEDNGIPAFYQDFKIPPGNTVSYVYAPPPVDLDLGGVSVQAPQAVRATFGPIPRVDQNVMRQVVANVQIMRAQQDGEGNATLDPPIVVPLSHCNFEPRGTVPYIGGTWYWNCAPGVYPLKPVVR